MKPIKMVDVYYNPEAVNERLKELNKRLGENAYGYNGDEYENLDNLECAYYECNPIKNKK